MSPECEEQRERIRHALERERFGLHRVQFMAGHGSVPNEVLLARIEGYNATVSDHLARQHRADWKTELLQDAEATFRRTAPECFGE